MGTLVILKPSEDLKSNILSLNPNYLRSQQSFQYQAPLCKSRGTYKYDFKVGQNLILASTYIHTFSSRDAIYRCCRLFGCCHVAKSYVSYHIVSVINMKLIKITIWHQHSTIIFSVPTMFSDLHIILKVTRTNVTSTKTTTTPKADNKMFYTNKILQILTLSPRNRRRAASKYLDLEIFISQVKILKNI